MPTRPAPAIEPRFDRTGDHRTPAGASFPPGAVLAVRRVGHLVPAEDFDGQVQSVFAGACNIDCGDLLLSLVAPGLGDGPTVLRLSGGAPGDLRDRFRAGDRVHRRGKLVQACGVGLSLADATVWRPAPLRPFAAVAQIAANLALASAALARRRWTHSSIVAREGAAVLAALAQACRDLDAGRASACAGRLIGWGEGLTPAGDDALVGCCAALEALAGRDGRRRAFRRSFGAAIEASTRRTTPLAAHWLRLAAGGHFNADVERLRGALLCGQDPVSVAHALDQALAAGATSGADMATGMIAGLSAWLGHLPGTQSAGQPEPKGTPGRQDARVGALRAPFLVTPLPHAASPE